MVTTRRGEAGGLKVFGWFVGQSLKTEVMRKSRFKNAVMCERERKWAIKRRLDEPG